MPAPLQKITTESTSSTNSFISTDTGSEYNSSSDLDQTDSASHPAISRQNSRRRGSSARPSQEHRRPPRVHRPPTPVEASTVDSSEYDVGYGRGYGPIPVPYAPRPPHPQSFASFPSAPYPSNSQMIPFGGPGGYPYRHNPMSNPFAPSPPPANYYNQPHHPPHAAGYLGSEMMPYGQSHGYYSPGFQGPSPPAHFYPPQYQIIQPLPPVEPPAKPSTPAPIVAPIPSPAPAPVGPPPPDPAIEAEKEKARAEKEKIEKEKAAWERKMAEEKYQNLQKALEEQQAVADKYRKDIADREAAEKAAAIEAERAAKHAAETKQAVDAAKSEVSAFKSEAEKWKKTYEEKAAAEKKAAEEAAAKAEIERRKEEAVAEIAKKKQDAVDAAMAEANKWRKKVEDREAAEAKAAKDAADKAELDRMVDLATKRALLDKEDKDRKAAEKKAADAEKAAAKEAEEKAELARIVDAATKKALLDKEDEDRKAAEKKAAEAKAEAEKAAANAPPPPPTAPEKKKPIRFKDAVGRKFSFPFHLCATWQGMEDLIKQAFLHVEIIGPHVAEGHYDLVGPNGEIILPQVWETMIEQDMAITMHMWPMPEPPKPPVHPPRGIIDVEPRLGRPPIPPPGGKRPGPPGPPPPPPSPPGFVGRGGGPGLVKHDKPKKKPQKTSFFGFSRPKPAGKGSKKP